MVSLFAMGVHRPDRLIQVKRIATLLRHPGGITMTRLVSILREPRDLVSDDLETMRDFLGYAIRWDPATGTYGLGPAPEPGEQTATGCDLALLYRAIALEEFLYVTFTTESGELRQVHALPGKICKRQGKFRLRLRERNGAWQRVELGSVHTVTEAFGLNK